VMGCASALRDFSLAIGSGSGLREVSVCALATTAWLKANVPANPADRKNSRRECLLNAWAPFTAGVLHEPGLWFVGW